MLGIFIYGCVVFAIVTTALVLIVWGIREERRDRELLAGELAEEPGMRAVAVQVAGDAPNPAP